VEGAGQADGWVKIADLYTTPPSTAIGSGQQRYFAADSSGRCYDRRLTSYAERRNSSLTGLFDGEGCDGLLAPVTLTASPAVSQGLGGQVQLTAALGADATSGLVEFFDGEASLGVAPYAEGAAVLTAPGLALGDHSFTARYAPDVASGAILVAGQPSAAVPYTVTAAPASVEAGSKCIAGKAYLTVTVANDSAGPLAFDVATPYGVKSFPSVAAGKTGFHTFTTRLASLAGVEVTVTATTPDGAKYGPYTQAVTATCG
jgi:hypothetical protein